MGNKQWAMKKFKLRGQRRKGVKGENMANWKRKNWLRGQRRKRDKREIQC